MTQPSLGGPQLPPLVDPGNTHLTAEIESDLVIGKAPVPGGEVGIGTIRQGNTTLTVPFTRDRAEQWIAVLIQLRDMLSGSGKLVTATQAPIVAASQGQRS